MALLVPLGLVATVAPASITAQGAGTSQQRSSIAGVVRDAIGFPVADAVVAVDGRADGQDEGRRWQVRTGADGRFRLTGVPAGAAVVVARRIGFGPQSYRLELVAGVESSLDVRLEPLAQRLDAVTVSQKREVYDARLAGYHARLESKRSGHFITRERLDRSTSWTLPDVLREIPGVRIAPLNGISKAVRLRGSSCAPLVFVDGFPASAGEFDLQMLDLESLEGVEVYPSMASLPAEFGAARGLERCGVIAAWSRPAPKPVRRQVGPLRVDVEAMVASGDVFTADQVQREARLDTTESPTASYPDSLWRAGEGGRVLLELVVRPDGEVEPGSVRVISATHGAFAEAARLALADSFFNPAVLGGRAVHQLVQIPVVFAPALTPSPASPPPS